VTITSVLIVVHNHSPIGSKLVVILVTLQCPFRHGLKGGIIELESLFLAMHRF
jgi:hypothetical protein